MSSIYRELFTSGDEHLEDSTDVLLHKVCGDLTTELRSLMWQLSKLKFEQDIVRGRISQVNQRTIFIKMAVASVCMLPSPWEVVALPVAHYSESAIAQNHNDTLEEFLEREKELQAEIDSLSVVLHQNIENVERIINAAPDFAPRIFFELGISSWFQDQKYIAIGIQMSGNKYEDFPVHESISHQEDFSDD